MRVRVEYQCQQCGAIAPKWAGQCTECGQWNCLTENAVQANKSTNIRSITASADQPNIISLAEVGLGDEVRQATGISELDRVLGGGMVPGSVVLIGGDPGIGKSTLLLQTLASALRQGQMSSLYISGEESARQVRARARRLDLDADRLRFLAETNVERLLQLVSQGIAPGPGDRFNPNRLYRRPEFRPRGGQPSTRKRHAAGALRQTQRRGIISGRACHQRWGTRRTPCVGTHGRYGVVFRG